jgi:hypothetical protein
MPHLRKRQAADITRGMIRSAESFLSKFEGARVVFALKNQNETKLLTETMAMLPLTALLFE